MSGDLVVVGGGPAGLGAALAAARRGHRVRLVEASERLGGMAASLTVAGQRVDLGSHRLHPVAPAPVQALLDGLLGSDLQTRERAGRLRLRDRWVGFPFRTVELVRSLPVGFTLAAGRDLLGRPLRRPRDGSYADVVRVGLGPAALAEFHGPMATKLWGLDPGRLSGELARRRISVDGPGALARRLVRSARPDGRRFCYPRLGYGQIVERLAEAAVDAGVEIRTGWRPETVRPGTDRVTLTCGCDQVDARRVFWTAPPDELPRLVPDGPADLAGSVEHRGMVLVYVALGVGRYQPYDAHYVPDPDVAFSRLSEPRNYRDGPDPADRTVLCAEVPATVGDRHWRGDPASLADEVLDGMARLGLPAAPVDAVEVVRLPRVYPRLTPAAAVRRRDLLAWADGLERVHVLGRQGRAVADNLHHVLDMALSAADCLGLDGDWDRASWRRHLARFDRFVVED